MGLDDVWIIVPAYNEESHISSVLDKIQEFHSNLVVIDDGSKDRTFEFASNSNVSVLRHLVNMGKGSALKTGADYAIMKGAKTLVFLDADNQHDPSLIPTFLDNLNGFDIVFGCRKLNGKMPCILRFGNWFISSIINLFSGISTYDSQSGFKVLTAEAYEKIRWKSREYGVETEIIFRTGINNLRYKEILIDTVYHSSYKGTTVLTGVKIVLELVKWRLFGL